MCIWVGGALSMGILRRQLFTALPKLSKQRRARLLCSDEGIVPLQGTGKLFAQENAFVQLNLYSRSHR